MVGVPHDPLLLALPAGRVSVQGRSLTHLRWVCPHRDILLVFFRVYRSGTSFWVSWMYRSCPHAPSRFYLWEGCRESRKCSRDTYPKSYITKYASIRRKRGEVFETVSRGVERMGRGTGPCPASAGTARACRSATVSRKVDVRLPEKKNSLFVNKELSLLGVGPI